MRENKNKIMKLLSCLVIVGILISIGQATTVEKAPVQNIYLYITKENGDTINIQEEITYEIISLSDGKTVYRNIYPKEIKVISIGPLPHPGKYKIIAFFKRSFGDKEGVLSTGVAETFVRAERGEDKVKIMLETRDEKLRQAMVEGRATYMAITGEDIENMAGISEPVITPIVTRILTGEELAKALSSNPYYVVVVSTGTLVLREGPEGAIKTLTSPEGFIRYGTSVGTGVILIKLGASAVTGAVVGVAVAVVVEVGLGSWNQQDFCKNSENDDLDFIINEEKKKLYVINHGQPIYNFDICPSIQENIVGPDCKQGIRIDSGEIKKIDLGFIPAEYKYDIGSFYDLTEGRPTYYCSHPHPGLWGSVPFLSTIGIDDAQKEYDLRVIEEPYIELKSYPHQVYLGEKIKVEARIIDNKGVSEAYLKVWIPEGSIREVCMDRKSGESDDGVWMTYVPYSDEEQLDFWIEAEDSDGKYAINNNDGQLFHIEILSFSIVASSGRDQYGPGDTANVLIGVTNKREEITEIWLGTTFKDPEGNEHDIPLKHAEIFEGEKKSFDVNLVIPDETPPGQYEIAVNCWKDAGQNEKYTDNLEWVPIFNVDITPPVIDIDAIFALISDFFEAIIVTLTEIVTSLQEKTINVPPEQKAIENVEGYLDALSSMAEAYSEFVKMICELSEVEPSECPEVKLNYHVLSSKFFKTGDEAKTYMSSNGIESAELRDALELVRELELEKAGFCIVIVDYSFMGFDEYESGRYPVVCNEKGDPFWESWQFYENIKKEIEEAYKEYE